MKTKIKREDLSTTITDIPVTLRMSEQAFFDLAVQKQTLTKLIDDSKSLQETEQLVGLRHLIDHIQDEAVGRYGYQEEVIFPFQNHDS